MDNQPTADLAHRIDRLERRCRRLTIGASALCLALFAIYTVPRVEAQGSRDWLVVRKGFKVVDETGKVRISLSDQGELGVGLALFDENGQGRAVLGYLPEVGPSLLLYDDRGANRVQLTQNPDVDPYLRLFDENENGRITLGYSPEVGPVMYLSDSAGNILTGVDKNGPFTP